MHGALRVHPPLTFIASARHAPGLSRLGLTLRSRGVPTASRQARRPGCHIFRPSGLASRRRRPLSSNVRPRVQTVAVRLQTARQGWLRLVSSRMHRVFSRLFNSRALPSLKLLGPRAASFTTELPIGTPPLQRSPSQRPSAWRALGLAQPQLHRASAPRPRPFAAGPNPSLKGSANSKPPGPPAGLAHFPSVGPGISLLAPA